MGFAHVHILCSHFLSQADDIPRYWVSVDLETPKRQKQCNHVSRVVFMFSGNYTKQYIDVIICNYIGSVRLVTLEIIDTYLISNRRTRFQ